MYILFKSKSDSVCSYIYKLADDMITIKTSWYFLNGKYINDNGKGKFWSNENVRSVRHVNGTWTVDVLNNDEFFLELL